MNVTHLECALCGLKHEAHRLHNVCTACGKPLLVRYDLDRAKMTLRKESLAARRPNLWRYREVLPIEDDDNSISLGEGWTPLLRATRLSTPKRGRARTNRDDRVTGTEATAFGEA